MGPPAVGASCCGQPHGRDGDTIRLAGNDNTPRGAIRYNHAMTLANVARVVVVLAACGAAVGSATSSSNNQNAQPTAAQAQPLGSPPPPEQMEPGRALGLWRSAFGAVKIEAHNSKGGLQTGAVQGVWVYQRQGQE